MLASSPIRLIVGLRNPGAAYRPTRHNAGAFFIEQLSACYSLRFQAKSKLKAEVAQLECSLHPPAENRLGKALPLDGEQLTCFIALPLVYMNESGWPVAALLRHYHLKPEEMLVVHDEIDLPVGCARLKSGGGHGGHNGLRHILATLHKHFHRLRIGVGHPGEARLVSDYVLTSPPPHEREAIERSIAQALESLPFLFAGQISAAMKQLHTQSKGA